MKWALGCFAMLLSTFAFATDILEPPKLGEAPPKALPTTGLAKRTVQHAVPHATVPYLFGGDTGSNLFNPHRQYERELSMHGTWRGQGRGSEDVSDLGGADSFQKFFSFDGLTQPSALRPADTDAAFGLRYMVQVVNASYAVYDKCGREIFTRTFASLVGGDAGDLFDPRVIYDPYNGRWVMLILRRDDANKVATVTVIVSATDNPSTDTWWYYDFNMTTGANPNQTWSDYYELGYSANALYASGNQFRFSDDAYRGGQILILKKSEAYAHQAVSFWKKFLPSTDSESDVFSMHCAEMMSTPATYDMVFVSTNRLGGTDLHVRKLADPFGAQTITLGTVDIDDFSTAPTAEQPVNDDLTSFDARPMNLMVARDSQTNQMHAWTGFMVAHRWPGDATDRMAIRAVNFDPGNLATKRLDVDWGASGRDYMFPHFVANYRGQAVLGFGRCGPAAPNYPETRFSAVEGMVLQLSDRIFPANPTISYTDDDRWGDYFGGSLDWADYAYGTTSNVQKIWINGMYANAEDVWDTGSGAVGIDATLGTMTVTNSSPVAYYFVGQTGTPTFTWSVINNTAGNVGFMYAVSRNVNWLTPPARPWGEVSQGRFEDTSFQVNANAAALPVGVHVGTITWRNCFTGGIVTNTVTLKLGKRVCPIGWAVTEGTHIAGNIGDTCVSDNQFFSLISDDATLATDVYFSSQEGQDHGSRLRFTIEASSLRYGLVQTVYLFNSSSNIWTQFDGRVAPTFDYPVSFQLDGANVDPYVSTNGTMFGRIRTQPINDEDPSLDGWVLNVDFVEFQTWP